MTGRRILAAVAIVFGLAACTPREHAAWLQWHAQDPVAAEAFAEEWKAQHAARATSSTNSWSVNWDRVAACESGGRWDYPPVTNRHGTFTGGLMIWTKTWDAYGGAEFASDAYLTSKANQIIVAERVVDDVGFDRAWQCDDQ